MTTVLICDDHPLILEGLVALLANEPQFNVVATSRDGAGALQAMRDHKPDIALLDLAVPIMDGLALARTIAEQRWPIRAVLLTAVIRDEKILEAIAAGISGIILKESASETLIHCLRVVARGDRWLPPELIRPAIQRRASAPRAAEPLDRLTRREKDVARQIADGASNREAAATLGLTEGTVKIHLHSIYSKLEIDNRTALAVLFALNGQHR